MEIVTIIFAAIGVVAILGVIYITVRQIHENTTEIENLKRWNRNLSDSLDKAFERYHKLADQVDVIEDLVAGDIASLVKQKRRK